MSRGLLRFAPIVAFLAISSSSLLNAAEDISEDATTDAVKAQREETQNAATYYLRAAEFLPRISWEERKQIRDALKKLDIATCSRLTEEHRDAFNKVFELVALGARCPGCDWGTDYSSAIDAPLPHIDDASLIVPAGLIRALQLVNEDRWNEGVDTWANSTTLARHISHDPCLVCVMVSIREEQIGIDVAKKMLSHAENRKQRTRLREAWESLPERLSVHSAAVKEHARLFAWAKSHPGDLQQFIGGSFMSGGMAGHWISTEPPSMVDKLQGTFLVQTANWPELQRLACLTAEITKLPAAEIEEAGDDLVAQIRSLPKGSTRTIASHLISNVSHGRKGECELEELGESLSKALQDPE